MNSTVIERLVWSIDWLKKSRIVLSQAEFSEKVGIKPSQVSEMLNGKRKISERTIHNIVEAFPDLNINWLLTGEGEMLKSDRMSEPQLTAIPSVDLAQSTIDRLLSIVESQQRTIETLSGTIKKLTSNEL